MGINIGGALAGAGTGAKLGSSGGPWGTAIGAGIGGLIGLFTGGKSKLQKNMENKIDPSMENLMHWSGQSRDKQNELYGLAMPAMRQANQFYSGILDPNTNNALNAILGPNRTAVNDSFQSTLNNIAMGGRGGGRNQQLSEAYFNRNRQLTELIPQARISAAEGLLKVGNQAGSQAINWGQLSTEQAQAVLQAALGGSLSQQQMQAAKDKGLGGILQSMGPMLTDILSKLDKRGGGGSSTGGGSSPMTGITGLWPEN